MYVIFPSRKIKKYITKPEKKPPIWNPFSGWSYSRILQNTVIPHPDGTD